MKKLGALVLGLASYGLCVDEYLPIEAGKVEIDVGYNYMSITGAYDSSGEKQDLPSGIEMSGNLIPLQIKYGIMPGLDVELAWTFASMKADLGPLGNADASGFGQPELALKYAMMDLGAGAFFNFIAPFATGDFADPDSPPMALQFGVVYSKLYGMFRAGAQIDYRINFEAEDSTKDGSVFSIYLKPEVQVHQYGSLYLGIDWDFVGESEFDGQGADDAGNLLTLKPGWNATWMPYLATEVNVPITLMGKNATASWGIWASVYLTLPM